MSRPSTSSRRTLRVLAAASHGGSSWADRSPASGQRRQLMMQALGRSHAGAAAAAAATDLQAPAVGAAAAAAAADLQGPAVSGAHTPPRPGILRRMLLSGVAAVALLAAAAYPRPATAFQLPGGLPGFGGRSSVAAPHAATAAVDVLPATMENKTPLPDLSQLSPEEVKTVSLFKENTPCVVNITNIATARGYYSMDIQKIPAGKFGGQ